MDKLKKSSMAFELKNGEILLISDEDVSEIAERVVIGMMTNNQNRVYVHKDSPLDKCKLLYDIVKENKDKMTDAVLASYFKKILELADDKATEYITLEKTEQ